MSPPDERRKHDKFPLEVREYIEAAAERGAEKAMVKLYSEIGRAGVKKAGIIILSILALIGAWLGIKPPS